MTREEFIKNYLRTEQLFIIDPSDGNCKGSELPEVRIILALIGSIYDLQQQIAQLQERIDL